MQFKNNSNSNSLLCYNFSVIGATLIVVGLYSVLWGKYKEFQEKEAEIIPKLVKGGPVMTIEDIEANIVELQKAEINEVPSAAPAVAIRAPMPLPPMIAVEAPKS